MGDVSILERLLPAEAENLPDVRRSGTVRGRSTYKMPDTWLRGAVLLAVLRGVAKSVHHLSVPDRLR